MKPLRRIASFLRLTRRPAPAKEPEEIAKLTASLEKVPLGEIEAPVRAERVRALLREFETLYKRDGTVFGMVNRLTRAIVGGAITPQAEDARVLQEFSTWLKMPQINFKETLKGIVTDILVYGNAFLELVPSKDGTTIARLNRLEPGLVDFKRDERFNVLLDPYGKPQTIVFTMPTGETKEIPKEKVAHFAFFKLPSDYLGISPLESIYHQLKYKVNLENSLAEGLFRTTYLPLVIRVGDKEHPPAPEIINQIRNSFKELERKYAIFLPYFVDVEKLGLGRGRPPERFVDLLEHLNAVILGAFGLPRTEEEISEYERAVKTLQEGLITQLRDELFTPLATRRKWPEVPTIIIAESSAQGALIRARGASYLARAGLITWDEKLENHIRSQFGYPLLGPLTEEEKEKRRKVQIRRRLELDSDEE